MTEPAPWNPESASILTRAAQLAHELGVGQNADHIGVALIEPAQREVRNLLQALGLDPTLIYADLIHRVIVEGTGPYYDSQALVIERMAVRLSGNSPVSPSHILLALMEEGGNQLSRALGNAGVTAEKVGREIDNPTVERPSADFDSTRRDAGVGPGLEMGAQLEGPGGQVGQ